MTAPTTSVLHRWRRLYYLNTALGFESFSAPVLIIFYTQYVGYGFQDYSQLISLIFIFNWVFHVPAGALADTFGRKQVLLSGYGIYMTAIGSLLAFREHCAMLVIALLFSLGSSLIGGTLQAMLFQVHAEHGQTRLFHQVVARGTSLALLSGACAAVAGGYLAEISPALPMLADLACMCLNALLLYIGIASTPRLPRAGGASWHRAYGHVLASGLRQVWRTPNLLAVILLSALVFACLRAGLNLYQPILTEHHVPLHQLGWFFAAFSLTSALAAYAFSLAPAALISSLKPVAMMALTFAVPPMALLAMATPGALAPTLAIMGHQIARGLWPSYFSFQVNSLLPSDTPDRATALSAALLIRSLVAALAVYLVGAASEANGTAHTFLALSLATALLLLAGSGLLLRGQHAGLAKTFSPSEH